MNLRSIPQKLRVRQKLYHLWLPLGLRRNGRRCGSDRIVAGMATMPTREKTFRPAFQSIIRQVDHLYLYLDGFETIPDIVKDHPRVTATLARQEEGLHANGKFLGLVYEQQPCLYVSVDDDIYYPHNFVARLRARLAAHNDQAIVGLHGKNLTRPFTSYNFGFNPDSTFDTPLKKDHAVDVLGSGALLFATEALQFDVRTWPHTSMADLGLAIEATKAGIPLISVTRGRFSALPLAIAQEDSLYVKRLKDDSLQTELCLQLLRLQEDTHRQAEEVQKLTQTAGKSGPNPDLHRQAFAN